ncbi:MAG: hypothetical protein AB7P20_14835 [Rhizobiaceae bacterium]
MFKLRIKLLLAPVVGFSLLAVDSFVQMPIGSFVSTAEARVGRPLTPGSVAGVARRTTRRVIRRSTIYAATLPAGCIRTSVNGTVVWSCRGVYYQPYGGRYVVVYID